MRGLILMPVMIVVTAACGYGLCHIVGADPHLHELLGASVITLLAAEAAMVPLLLSRGESQLVVTQAALIASGIHLLLSIILAAGAMFAHIGFEQPLLYWLLPLYWMTLTVLVIMLVRAVKSAPIASKLASPDHPTN